MPTWLVKQEPTTYAWAAFLADGKTDWTGVRNYAARNNLAAMQPGDEVFYYHSNVGLEIVGIARVTKAAYPDPTADDPRWVAVELAPVAQLKAPVSLAALKGDRRTQGMEFIRIGRLSVSPVRDGERAAILEMAGGTTPIASAKPSSKKK